MLAYKMCNKLEDKIFLSVQPRDERDNALLFRTLSMKITQNTVDKIAALHEPFSKPQSCRSKELGRAATSGISNTTGHGCVKLEGHHWKNP